MALNWQAAVIPPGKSFADVLYDFLLPLEASSTEERYMPAPVLSKGGTQNATIGIGFDLRAGGTPVQNAVLKALGFSAAVVDLGKSPTLDGSATAAAQLAEYSYIQQIRSLVANTSSGSKSGLRTALNAIMAKRASDTTAAYDVVAPIRKSTFTFSSEAEVKAAFDPLWTTVYRDRITARYSFLADALEPSFSGSRRRPPAFSSGWV